MSDLDALLAGIVADLHNALRWLIMADWLDDHGFPERAELVRVHRELLRTCTDPDAHPERPQLHARMMELMRAGVQPCLPQKTLILPGGVKLRMSFIPPGSFLMGSPETEEGHQSDEQQHRVTLTKGFWLGQTPVTQRQWWAVLDERPNYDVQDDLPITRVSWEDARLFCETVTERTRNQVRLPTEAEWEYAARGGTTTPFHWGTELNGTQANCRGERTFGTQVKGPYLRETSKVGYYTDVSPHPWSLSDVIGNVWEWCEEYSSECPDSVAADPVKPESDSRRLLRGGSWMDDAWECRVAHRIKYPPGCWYDYLGLRLAAYGDSLGPLHFSLSG